MRDTFPEFVETCGMLENETKFTQEEEKVPLKEGGRKERRLRWDKKG